VKHARVAPSSLNHNCECTASLNFCSDSELPDLPGDESEEGNVAHELGASMLMGVAYDNPLIDDTMRSYVEDYFNYCMSFGGNCDVRFIEHHVKIPQVHKECEGTLDFGAIVGNTLHIVDLKYGYRYVEVYHNRQLLAYARGLCNEYPHVELVVMHIFQPRLYHRDGVARSWTLSVDGLNIHIDVIANRIELADSASAYFETGTHCYKCPRLHDCEAGTVASYNAIDVIMSQNNSINSDSTQLGNDLLMIEQAERVLKDRKTALKEVIEFRLKSGVQCPTHYLETSRGNRRWNVTEEEVEASAVLAGVDAMDHKLKSPAAMERAGLDKKTVKSMITQPSYSKLVAVNFKQIKKVFNNG